MACRRVGGEDAAMKQTSFASAEFAGEKRKTRREKFLEEMEAVVPWARLEALIEPQSTMPWRSPSKPRSKFTLLGGASVRTTGRRLP